MQSIAILPSVSAARTSLITVNQSYFTHNSSSSSSSSSSSFSSSKVLLHDPLSQLPSASRPLLNSGLARASQVADLFPALSPEIVIREARLEDWWEVAETHCTSFFPGYSFPLHFAVRINSMISMFYAFSLPDGCRRTCLVALVDSSSEESAFFFTDEDYRNEGIDGRFSLSKGYVVGILTLDTLANFLPRKGPMRERRKGIAYISNVAVREKYRRKGIARKLIARAETQAKSWGCRSVALHCDKKNPAATELYKRQGFKSVKIPQGAKWPQPTTSPDVEFNFMLKILQ